MKITDLGLQLGKFHLQIDQLAINERKIHGLVGGNGSGKTTLAKLIMGILEPDRGEIDYQNWQPRDITMTSQRPYLLQCSVYENIVYPLKIRGCKPNQAEIDHWLNQYGLFDKKYQYAKSLSSGERQKLSFIRAVIFRPKLIIIDETFSNLDSDTVSLMEAWILQKQQTDPTTYLIISHQMNHILRLCDVVHMMDHGRLLESGESKQVLFHPQQTQTRKYMASHVIRIEEGQ